MKKETKELYKRAYVLWGNTPLLMAVMGEAGELIKTLCKWWLRADPSLIKGIVKGIGGLKFILEQLEVAFKCEEEVERIQLTKLKQLRTCIKKKETDDRI